MPFGETLDQRGSLITAKGFTNHEQTDPSGLIYMQARFYLPQYHRFTAPDPARDQHFEETQSWNIYSYCQNQPVMKIDPTGMDNFWNTFGHHPDSSSDTTDGSLAQTTLASTTFTTTTLSVVNGGSGEYNATATLTQSTTTLSFSLENGLQFSDSRTPDIPPEN